MLSREITQDMWIRLMRACVSVSSGVVPGTRSAETGVLLGFPPVKRFGARDCALNETARSEFFSLPR